MVRAVAEAVEQLQSSEGESRIEKIVTLPEELFRLNCISTKFGAAHLCI